MLDGPPPLWASGNPSLGNPRYRPSAPAFGAFAAAVGPALRRPRRPLHPLERAEPAAVDPAAGRLRQEALLAGLGRHLPRDGQRRVPGHPRASTPPPPCSSARSRPPAATSRAATRTCARSTFLRALGCLDAKLRPVTHRRLPWLSARARRRLRLPPAQHAQPARPALRAPPTTPTSASLRGSSTCSTSCSAGAGSGAARRRWASGSTSTATRPTRPTSCAASRPAARTSTSSRRRTWPGAIRASSCSRSTCGSTSRSAAASATPAGSRACTTPTAEPKPALAHFAHPMWLDFASSTLWGQVRPGGVHAVQVQVRVAGAGTPWQTRGRRHDRRATATGRCAPR